MKRLLAYLFIVFWLGLTFSVNAEAKEKVKIGNPGWTGATVIANLLAAVVNDKIGGEAELVPGNNTAIYVQLIEVKVKLKFTLISGYQTNKPILIAWFKKEL